jgi:hypothetical protein
MIALFWEILIFYMKQPNIWIKSEIMDAIEFSTVEYTDVYSLKAFVSCHFMITFWAVESIVKQNEE